jgi:hypothetical protein
MVAEIESSSTDREFGRHRSSPLAAESMSSEARWGEMGRDGARWGEMGRDNWVAP